LAWKVLFDPMEGPKNTKTVPDTFVFCHEREGSAIHGLR